MAIRTFYKQKDNAGWLTAKQAIEEYVTYYGDWVYREELIKLATYMAHVDKEVAEEALEYIVNRNKLYYYHPEHGLIMVKDIKLV